MRKILQKCGQSNRNPAVARMMQGERENHCIWKMNCRQKRVAGQDTEAAADAPEAAPPVGIRRNHNWFVYFLEPPVLVRKTELPALADYPV